jgi:hypothetical protein
MNASASGHAGSAPPGHTLQSVVDGLLERFAWKDPSRKPLPRQAVPLRPVDLDQLDPDQRVRAVGEW